MPSPRIVIIGAGSASFGSNTLATLARMTDLKGSDLRLVDLNWQSLQAMRGLAERLSQAWGANFRVSVSTDRRELLPGADFVIVSIEVPPREALWRQDWSLTLRHGLRQPYGENGGPGGLIHAFRQIPPFLEIVRDMEALCPEAWLINFSNPLPRITRAVTKYSGIRTVGKCHQLNVGYAIAAVLLKERFGFQVASDVDLHSDPAHALRTRQIAALARQEISITAAGLNHFTWMKEIRDRHTGEDLYPDLRAAALNPPATLEPLSMALFQLFDLCPVPGDSHLCEYLPWAHDSAAKPWERYNLRLYHWEGNEAKRDSDQARIAQMAAGHVGVDELKEAHSEGAAEIIQAMVTDRPFYDEAINVPNGSAIPNMPADTIVEVPAIIGSQGITPASLEPLPQPIAELCRREAALVEMVVDAAVSGDRDLALHALLMDPMMNDIDRARAVLDDYLETMAAYLPQFKHRRRTYAAPSAP